MDVQKRVYETITECFGIPENEINESERLCDIADDSLETVMFFLAIEQTFGVTFDEDEVVEAYHNYALDEIIARIEEKI
ncbi:MAG: hypothetical protein IJ689_07080 [Alphaproteobacteria bacterium]|nr:hypothetical protein [Alphaproteobacteria bacterium]